MLSALPPAVFDHIRPAMEVVDLVRGQVIYHVDEPVTQIYFVDRGLISLVKSMQDGRTVEIGAVGIEGFSGCFALVSGEPAIFEALVQIPGSAFCLGADVLRKEMERNETVRGLVQKYLHYCLGQLAQTAACNRLHSLEERCCRWLLIAHDNARSDRFQLTHEFLAMMLGVQRAGVSLTMNILQRAGLVSYARGVVTVTDRSALESASCECYVTVHAQLDRFFGAPKTSRAV
jgi:CRP-like cAMP-binding protein